MLLGILIYVLVSIGMGFLIGFLAKRKKQKFVIWLIYGILALPIAITHLIAIYLNHKILGYICYGLIVVYFFVSFFWSAWFFTTQLESMIQIPNAEAKLKLGNAILDNLDEITALSDQTELDNLLAEKTSLAPNTVDNLILSVKTYAMKDFDITMISNREYMKEYGLRIVHSVRENIDRMNQIGIFSEKTVAQGKARIIYETYASALRLLLPITSDVYPYLVNKLQSLQSRMETLPVEYKIAEDDAISRGIDPTFLDPKVSQLKGEKEELETEILELKDTVLPNMLSTIGAYTELLKIDVRYLRKIEGANEYAAYLDEQLHKAGSFQKQTEYLYNYDDILSEIQFFDKARTAVVYATFLSILDGYKKELDGTRSLLVSPSIKNLAELIDGYSMIITKCEEKHEWERAVTCYSIIIDLYKNAIKITQGRELTDTEKEYASYKNLYTAYENKVKIKSENLKQNDSAVDYLNYLSVRLSEVSVEEIWSFIEKFEFLEDMFLANREIEYAVQSRNKVMEIISAFKTHIDAVVAATTDIEGWVSAVAVYDLCIDKYEALKQWDQKLTVLANKESLLQTIIAFIDTNGIDDSPNSNRSDIDYGNYKFYLEQNYLKIIELETQKFEPNRQTLSKSEKFMVYLKNEMDISEKRIAAFEAKIKQLQEEYNRYYREELYPNFWSRKRIAVETKNNINAIIKKYESIKDFNIRRRLDLKLYYDRLSQVFKNKNINALNTCYEKIVVLYEEIIATVQSEGIDPSNPYKSTSALEGYNYFLDKFKKLQKNTEKLINK